MTVAEIIAWAERYYSSKESNANKIIDLNLIHKKIYMKLKRLKHEYEIDEEEETVAGEVEYDLPSDCRIDNIIKVEVETPDGADFDVYKYAGLNDTLGGGRYYRAGVGNKIKLYHFGTAIHYDDAPIRITYYKTPAEITLVTDTPDLDEQYHLLLCHALTQALASQGHNPDGGVADYHQEAYDELFKEVEADLSDKFNSAPSTYRQIKEWW